ncbi:hypothetical protein ACEPAH_2488 [Sanghuangporus vaninii]
MPSTTSGSKKRSYDEQYERNQDSDREEPKKLKHTDSELDAETKRYQRTSQEKAGKEEQQTSDKQSRVKFKD